jgi:hypothetical protein
MDMDTEFLPILHDDTGLELRGASHFKAIFSQIIANVRIPAGIQINL